MGNVGLMVDVHQHPMVLPEEMEELTAYLRANDYCWGYQAATHGGWTAVATANFYRGLVNTPDLRNGVHTLAIHSVRKSR